MLILLKGVLETLDYFVDSMAAGRDDAIVLDKSDPGFYKRMGELIPYMQGDVTVVIFNNVGKQLELSDGRNVWEANGATVYNFLVDHPVNYMQSLDVEALNGEVFLVIDRRHKLFIDRYFPKCKSYFMPHGGTRKYDSIPWDERSIPVLYCGSCQKEIESVPIIESMEEWGPALYDFVAEKMMLESYPEVGAVVRSFLEKENIELAPEIEREIILMAHATVERMVRRSFKLQTIASLAEAGIPVDIYGENWEEVAELYPGLIRIHERVSSDECVRLIGDAKISLNLCTFYGDGSHERVYIAMLQKAVCISEKSMYFEEKFEHGREIVYLDYSMPDVMVDDIKFLLSHPAEAVKITENAYIRAAHSTWGDRLDAIVRGDFDGMAMV